LVQLSWFLQLAMLAFLLCLGNKSGTGSRWGSFRGTGRRRYIPAFPPGTGSRKLARQNRSCSCNRTICPCTSRDRSSRCRRVPRCSLVAGMVRGSTDCQSRCSTGSRWGSTCGRDSGTSTGRDSRCCTCPRTRLNHCSWRCTDFGWQRSRRRIRQLRRPKQ